jgi:hypothetical protein
MPGAEVDETVAERRHMAAAIASGVVRVDSSKHTNPQEVARISLAIADEIVAQSVGAPAETDEAEPPKGKKKDKEKTATT